MGWIGKTDSLYTKIWSQGEARNGSSNLHLTEFEMYNGCTVERVMECVIKVHTKVRLMLLLRICPAFQTAQTTQETQAIQSIQIAWLLKQFKQLK